MTRDEYRKSAEQNDQQGAQGLSKEGVNPPAAKPEEKPPQAVVPPPKPPENLGANASAQSNEGKHDCHKGISVKVIKDNTLSSSERRSLILAWANLVVLFITFAVFYFQLRESKTQTSIFRKQADQAIRDAQLTRNQTDTQIQTAKDQFVADERPYIWTREKPSDWPADHAISGEDSEHHFYWDVFYQNFGRSPAIKFCGKAWVVTGENALSKVADIQYNVCPPNAGNILAPAQVQWLSGRTKDTATQADYEKWAAIEHGIVIFGRFDYSDNFGKQYFSQFCLYRQKNGVVAYCEQHNHVQ